MSNYSDIVHTNLINDAGIDALRTSGLECLVTGIASLSKGRIKVAAISTKVAGEKNHAIMSLDSGVPVFRVCRGLNSYEVHRRSGTIDGPSWEEMIESKNLSHVMKLLAEDRSGKTYRRRASAKSVRNIGDNIGEYVDIMDKTEQQTIVSRISSIRNRALRETGLPNQFSVTNPLGIKALLNMYKNPNAALNFTQDELNSINTIIKENEMYEKAAEKNREMLRQAIGNDKWMIQTYPFGYLAICKLRPDCTLNGTGTNEMLRPWSLHKSLDDLPSDIRDEVLSRLTMDKTVLGGAFGPALPNVDPVDPQGLLPAIDLYAHQYGYAAYSTGYRPNFGVNVVLDV